MPMTNNGAIFAAAQMIGGDGVPTLANGVAYLGVGDSTTAFSASHVDLQGTNKLRKLCTAVSRGAGTAVLTFVTTFGTTEANWAWEEFGIFNSSNATGTTGTGMFSRKVQSLGTKTSASSWQFTVTGTVSA